MKNENERALLARKLEEYLNGKAKDIKESIAKIERTGSLLDDYIVPTESLVFGQRIADSEVLMQFDYTDPESGSLQHVTSTLHDHALGQIGDKFGVPPQYLRRISRGRPWQRNLATTTMQEHALNVERDRVLIRNVEGQTRGFLSDRYRRINSMEIFIAFLLAAKESGCVLVGAHSAETTGWMEVVNPQIVEFDTPKNGRNYGAIGMRIRSSDFGDGALEMYLFMKLVKCMNGIVGDRQLWEKHLGGRIPENFKISEDTQRKDTAAKAALVRDVMEQVGTPALTNGLIGKIQDASAVEIDLKKEVEKLPKLGLTIAEAQMVEKALLENKSEDNLQGSPTLWKLVNGLTAVARDAEPLRGRELEQIAGSLLIK